MVRTIALAFDQITRLEVDEPIRTGADRLQVVRRIPRIGALVSLEQMFGDNHALADKSVRPKRRRLCEVHPNRQRIELFDLDVPVDGDRRGGRRRVGTVFPIEDDIIGSERLTIVPEHALFEFPGY